MSTRCTWHSIDWNQKTSETVHRAPEAFQRLQIRLRMELTEKQEVCFRRLRVLQTTFSLEASATDPKIWNETRDGQLSRSQKSFLIHCVLQASGIELIPASGTKTRHQLPEVTYRKLCLAGLPSH